MDTHAMESGPAEARGCKYGGNDNVRQDMPRPRHRNMAPSAARVDMLGNVMVEFFLANLNRIGKASIIKGIGG